MKHGRETLNELATQAGRDPRSIQVVAFLHPLIPQGYSTEGGGSGRASHSAGDQGEQEALANLEEIAQQVLP